MADCPDSPLQDGGTGPPAADRVQNLPRDRPPLKGAARIPRPVYVENRQHRAAVPEKKETREQVLKTTPLPAQGQCPED